VKPRVKITVGAVVLSENESALIYRLALRELHWARRRKENLQHIVDLLRAGEAREWSESGEPAAEEAEDSDPSTAWQDEAERRLAERDQIDRPKHEEAKQ